jgi:hypothetical protein
MIKVEWLADVVLLILNSVVISLVKYSSVEIAHSSSQWKSKASSTDQKEGETYDKIEIHAANMVKRSEFFF